MTTEDQAAVHRAHLERLGADGGTLTAHSKHSTSQNPEWFNVRRGTPLDVRRQLHTEILARFTESHPEVRKNTGSHTYHNMPNPNGALQTHLIRPSRTYYDRKRAEGKRHNHALIALARRRSDVLFAMLRDGTLYQDPGTTESALSRLTKTIEAPPGRFCFPQEVMGRYRRLVPMSLPIR